MKPLFLIFLIVLSVESVAQSSDSYKAQSEKISNLLDRRNQKFDQYQNSLSQKSGIFGSKTKRDMQESIDILTEIVETDNIIMEETRQLLEYKDIEKTKAEKQATNIKATALDAKAKLKNYQDSISSLSARNTSLSQTATRWQKEKDSYSIGLFLLGLTGLSLLLLSLKQKRI